jgi:genome maintenance exonuclease 1
LQEKSSDFALKLFEPKTLKRINEDGKRLYVTESGEKYPSVTSALGALSRKKIWEWRKRVGAETANKISTQASRAGTAVHQIAEDYILNQLKEDANPIALNTFRTIQPYLDQNVDEIYGVELQMYSDELKTAGTADLICRYDGKNTILDFKTSKRWKSKDEIKSYFMQGAAYATMVKEHYDMDIERIVILMAVGGGEGSLVFDEALEDWQPMTRKFFDLYHKGKLKDF